MENLEIRTFQNEDSEIRMKKDSRTITGSAIVFNRDSKLLYENNQLFYERISSSAMEGVVERSDIFVWLNHDKARGLLARSKNGEGSLSVSIDNNSVRYSFEAPNFALGDELIENIKRGDLKGTSFGFRVAEGGERWVVRADGSKLRIINKFSEIRDISPCYDPAYEDTTVALRSLQSLKEEDLKPEIEEPEVKPVTEEPVIEPVIPEPVRMVKTDINLINKKMLTIEELKEKRANAFEENDKIFELKNTENRTMTDKEEAIVSANNKLTKELDFQIETEVRKQGNSSFTGPYIKVVKEREAFSLLKSINALVERREMPAASRDMFVRGRESFRQAGITAAGEILLPELRANELVSGTDNLGQDLVPEDKKAILPPLQNNLVFTKAGATYLTGLTGTVSVPSFSDATIAWKGEIAAAVTAGMTTAEVTFSPRRLTAFMEVSKLFLQQSGPAAERMLMEILSSATARKLESTILGIVVGSADQPQGMGYKTTTGTDTKANAVVPTYAALVNMEAAVDAANAAVGNLAYITNAGGRGILKQIDKGVNNDTGDMLCSETNIVNGYPLYVTNGASAVAGDDDIGDLLVFGNWKDLCIGQWGGYDITVDPYSAAKNGMVILTINAYFDAKGLRGTAATDVHGTVSTVADDYAISFSSISIK